MRKVAKHLWVKKIARYLDDILLAIGLIIISYGVHLIYLPLGYISIGLGLVLFAHLIARSRGGD